VRLGVRKKKKIVLEEKRGKEYSKKEEKKRLGKLNIRTIDSQEITSRGRKVGKKLHVEERAESES